MFNKLARLLQPKTDRPNLHRVDFLVVGAQKAGTTALDTYLRLHPALCMPKQKETHFFDRDEYFTGKRLSNRYRRYHRQFAPGPGHQLFGEATPIYMYWQPVAHRIHAYNPSTKLIVILRNPIERAYSHWNMALDKGLEDADFWAAIQTESARRRAMGAEQHRTFSYVDQGFYIHQLRRLWAYFPKEQTLVLRTSALRSSPNQVLGRVSKFLGIQAFEPVKHRDIHARPYKTKLSKRERDYLRSAYADSISELEKELGWDCSDWQS